MKWLLLASAICVLPGCESAAVDLGYGAGINLAGLLFLGRAPPDVVVSAFSGRDCSIVNLDNRRPYCAPEDAPPMPPIACTASLGTVDCWQSAPRGQTMLADQQTLTVAQQTHLRQGWLGRQLGLDLQ